MHLRSTVLCLLVLATCQANAFPGLNDWTNIFHRIEDRLNQVIGNTRQRIEDIAGRLGNITRNLEEVAHCYEAQIGDKQLNIFNPNLSIRTIADAYFVSAKEILDHFTSD